MAVIAKSVASLRIFGDDLNPEEISRLLDAQPTASSRKGEVGARGATAKWGSWRLRVADRTPGDLNGQVIELLASLTSDPEVWAVLTARYRVDLFCGLFIEEGNEGFNLSVPALKALGDRGIELALDIYAPDPE
jgi:hypothetical protein